MASNTYGIYPADLGPGCFRLLRFVQQASEGVASMPIWQLAVHELAECPPYTALSYCWNEPQAVSTTGVSVAHRVSINGRRVPVAPNLYHALAQLAKSDHAKRNGCFWIDALCINQDSDAERTSQVSIMHLIYRQAASVYVWLGPDLDGEVRMVCEFLRFLLQKYWTDDPGLRKISHKLGFLDDGAKVLAASLPGIYDRIWRQVFNFWERGWFSRVWVLQEVALAKQAFFWCGNVEFTQQELIACSRFFEQSKLSNTLVSLRIANYDPVRNVLHVSRWTYVGRQVGTSAIRIRSLQSRVRGEDIDEWRDDKQASDRVLGPTSHGPSSDSELSIPLLRLFARELFLTSRDDCTDPRDRVFSLLVLMKQTAEAHGWPPLPLEIDYSKDVATVFTETTAWMIETSGWLGMLSMIHPQRPLPKTDTAMPSWVPDLHSAPPKPLHTFDASMGTRIAKHAALLSLETRPSILPGPQLLVSARRIGVVHDMGDSYDDLMERGIFEATARLLLRVPDAVWPNYTRVDYWADAMECALAPQLQPPDSPRRRKTRDWLVHKILRRYISSPAGAERLAKVQHHLRTKMPSFDALAQADVTGTLPTLQDWSTMYASAEAQAEALKDQEADFAASYCRRLFRLVELGFPHCPSATLLGMGPEAVGPGDEVFEVVGSVMPLVFRRVRRKDEATCLGPARAQVLGEAFLTGYGEIALERMDRLPRERFEIV